MQFLGKKQALDDMLQNTAIVLAIESLCSRHSQIGRRCGFAVGHECAEHSLSHALVWPSKRLLGKRKALQMIGLVRKTPERDSFKYM